jgi:XTP/dITP diphosphohydrolase
MASVVGSVAGMIQYQPEGNEGFGYDPVFYLPSYAQTMSQIPLAAKNRISHRSDATGKAVEVLKKLVESRSLPSD